MKCLRFDPRSGFRQLVGIGGVGAGIFFELEGDATLGRNESRLGRQLDVRDYCKLHIIIHYVAKLLGAGVSRNDFHVLPVARVGDDAPGQRVTREMRDTGIDTGRIQQIAASPTLFSVCFQYPDGSGGNITTNHSAASLLSEQDVDTVENILQEGGRGLIALAAPEVPLSIRNYFLQVASRHQCFRTASFAAAEVKAARDLGMFENLDLVSLNEGEGAEFVGAEFAEHAPENFVWRCQDLLRRSYPDLRVIISAGKLGAFGITAERSQFCGAREVAVASTAGAGDSLLGGVLAALAAGIPFLSDKSGPEEEGQGTLGSALQFGVLLGSYKCTSPHTIHPQASLEKLIAFAEEQHLSFSDRFKERMQDCLAQVRSPGLSA